MCMFFFFYRDSGLSDFSEAQGSLIVLINIKLVRKFELFAPTVGGTVA